MEIVFAAGTHVPGDSPSGDGRPPSGTHYEMYVVKDGYSFHLRNFEIKPAVTRTDPCLMEDEASTYPYTAIPATGLHSTQWYNKLEQLYLADGVVTPDEAGALADAIVRIDDMARWERFVKVVVATIYGPPRAGEPPPDVRAYEADLAALAEMVPAPELTDDESNAARWAICQEFFRKYPLHYVGFDRLVTLPLNGVYFGVVEGRNVRNNSGIGGAFMDFDAALEEFDIFRVNWQFNHLDDPRIAEWGPSAIGYHYMSGEPFRRTRGTINVSLRNRNNFVNISAEAAIFPALGRDEVNF